MIILNAHTTSDGFLESLKSFIQSHNLQFDCHQLDGSTVIIAKVSVQMATEPGQDTAQDADGMAVDTVAPETDITPADYAMPTDFNTEYSAAEVDTIPCETQEPQTGGECTILNLGPCSIPYSIDSTLQCSTLKVGNVENLVDVVIFNYCGTTFKYPKVEQGQESPIIRVVVRFDDTGETSPYFVALVQKGQDEIESLTLNSNQPGASFEAADGHRG